MLKELAVRSMSGSYCSSAESRACRWSGRKSHPDDIQVCSLSGLAFHSEFAAAHDPPRLKALVVLLDGTERSADESARWGEAAAKVSAVLSGQKCSVEAAVLSPNQGCLAVSAEIRTLLGMRVHQAGAVISLSDNTVVGRVVRGKRTKDGWTELRAK
jgi:hypothetical protein